MSTERRFGEKITRTSKLIDVGTIVGALIFGGLSQALAATAIQFSVLTLAGAEIAESEIKRRSKR